MLRHSQMTRAWLLMMGTAILLMTTGIWAQPGNSPTAVDQQMQEMVLQWGYLQSQHAVQNPPDILGGPIRISVRQDSGSVRVISPNGQPGSEPITTVTDLSQGRFTLQAVDATATDATRTRDTVNFQARWTDPQGNTYAVRCNRVVSRGAEYPVFGGVVTNHVLYGISMRGLPAAPTGFTYVAFWGTGDALRNGRIVGRSVAVQAALTEVSESHRSATGDPVLAQRRQFHVLVMPFSFVPGDNAAVQQSVSTGNTRAPGREQPCWQVAFDNPQVTATRVPTVRQTRLAGGLQDGPGVGSSAAQGMPAEAAVVGMTNSFQYVPRDIKIAVGQAVEWRNTSSVPHTVTCDPSLARNPQNVQLPEGAEPFNSGTMAPGAVFGYTFTIPGLYKYFCIPHEYAGMVGTVEVIGEP